MLLANLFRFACILHLSTMFTRNDSWYDEQVFFHFGSEVKFLFTSYFLWELINLNVSILSMCISNLYICMHMCAYTRRVAAENKFRFSPFFTLLKILVNFSLFLNALSSSLSQCWTCVRKNLVSVFPILHPHTFLVACHGRILLSRMLSNHLHPES